MEILENKEFCDKYGSTLLPSSFFLSNDIIGFSRSKIFNFLKTKILYILSGMVLENYDGWLRFIQSELDANPQLKFITNKYEISPQELDYFYGILKDTRDNLLKRFEKSDGMWLKINAVVLKFSLHENQNLRFPKILQGMIQKRIPLNIKSREPCQYPLFFD